ncbi:MAG TPA: hypothetical protein VF516_26990 [Kofleriaceae bacterium]
METQAEIAKAASGFRKKTEAIRSSAYSFPRKRDAERSRDLGWR